MSPEDVEARGATAKGKRQVDLNNWAKAKLMPTARQEDGESCGAHPGVVDSLTAVARLMPTCQARDQHTIAKVRRGANSPGGTPLAVACAKLMPTPDANCHKGGKPNQRRGQLNGQLNPEFVEIFMGYPKGWTSLPWKP